MRKTYLTGIGMLILFSSATRLMAQNRWEGRVPSRTGDRLAKVPANAPGRSRGSGPLVRYQR